MKTNNTKIQWQAQKRRCVEDLLNNDDKIKRPFLMALLALCLQELNCEFRN